MTNRAAQPHGKMNVVSNTTNAVGFALRISAHGGQIGMHARANLRVEEVLAIFGAEHNVNENLAE